MLKIQKRWIDDGVVNPTDQVLMAKHLLEATLMGGLCLDFAFWSRFDWMGKLLVQRKSKSWRESSQQLPSRKMGKRVQDRKWIVIISNHCSIFLLFCSRTFVFELLTKLSIGSSSYNGILVFAAVSSIKPRKIRTESADNRSINLIAA
ncbi:hypothetical protein JRO89_XS09G0181700 [Xanthoceras sorbifolium]|uniref:Uncharacterized protein n=1 Tax=Xanthoceras sorbifolium TaxID=99658 RepID=A0ABQ8HLQ7_9ROSI|nr:hypothetical protein JRO89_XS09G0181700 [Xanthoceras sorbifolium]